MLPGGCCEPGEFFFGKNFAAASPVMQTDDHRVEFPPIEALKQVTRRSDPDLDHQLRVLRVHARDQRREFRARDMVADADGEAQPGSAQHGERAFVYLPEFSGMFEEGCASRRELHIAGRSLDEPAAEPFFKSLQLQADRALRRAHDFGSTREAGKLGDSDKSPDGIQVEGTVYHFEILSLISICISFINMLRAANVKLGHCGGIAMPLLHISLCAGKPDSYRQAILDGLYRAMRETLSVPEDDQFMTITEHDAANFRYGNAYGVARSADVVYVQITVFNTRTLEQKKALFRRIAELFSESPGIRPEDVFVVVLEAAKENWSVGHGLAQFA